MAERREVSLLDCAIAASLAVVPVLIGVVALVAFVRQADAPLVVSAAQLLEEVAPCRREWSADDGPMPRLRHWLVGGAPEAAPADEIATHLGELDRALLRFSGRANARVEHSVGLDATRWFAAARDALATPIETSDAPGQQF